MITYPLAMLNRLRFAVVAMHIPLEEEARKELHSLALKWSILQENVQESKRPGGALILETMARAWRLLGETITDQEKSAALDIALHFITDSPQDYLDTLTFQFVANHAANERQLTQATFDWLHAVAHEAQCSPQNSDIAPPCLKKNPSPAGSPFAQCGHQRPC